MFASQCRRDARWSVPRDGASKLSGQAAGVARVIELYIIDHEAKPAQLICEGPHGGENKDDLFPMVRNIVRLVRNLSHQDNVIRGGPAQGGEVGGELVAKDEAQTGHDGYTRRDVSWTCGQADCLDGYASLPGSISG